MTHTRDVLYYAVRRLARSPGFAPLALLTLTLGVGTATAMTGVVDALLVRALPRPAAARLVRVVQFLRGRPEAPEPVRAGLSFEQFAAIRGRTRSVTNVGLYAIEREPVTGGAFPSLLTGCRVTPELFAALGVTPALGRRFSESHTPVAEPVVVLSHRTWTQQFGGNPGVLDRVIRIGGAPHTIVGVMPADFAFPHSREVTYRDSDGQFDTAPAYWAPLAPPQPSDGTQSLYSAAALVASHRDVQAATAELSARLPPLRRLDRLRVEAVPFQLEETRAVRPALRVFLAAAVLVLLVSSLNLANLFLIRDAQHQQDFAVRLAVGATRFQAMGVILAELGLLCLGGSVTGGATAHLMLDTLTRVRPDVMRTVDRSVFDPVLWSTAAMISMAACTLIGVMLLVRSSRVDRRRTVVSHAATRYLGSAPAPWHRLPLLLQLASAIALFSTSALLLNSYVRMTHVDRGFSTIDALTFRTLLPGEDHKRTMAAHNLFAERLASQLRALPGVDGVAAVEGSFKRPLIRTRLAVDGKVAKASVAGFRIVTPELFHVLRITPLQGRLLARSDARPAAAVAMVNQTFVNSHLPDEALGHHVRFGDGAPLTIVGVLPDIRSDRVDVPVRPEVFVLPDDARGLAAPTWLVTTRGGDDTLLRLVRKTLRRQAPDSVLYEPMTLSALVESGSVDDARLRTLVAILFAGTALALAVIGVYGVFGYAVSRRTREFGVRLALGADAARIRRLVLREVLILALLGGGLGLVASLLLADSLRRLLFGVQPRDPATFAVVAASFVVIAVAAAYRPAQRAAALSPSIALRLE